MAFAIKYNIININQSNINNFIRSIFFKYCFGNNIRLIRQENKLTQKQFGEKLGFSARTVSDWEYGNTEPDMKTIKKMVKIFDLSYEDIFEN